MEKRVLSVVMPVYNEKATVSKIIDKVLKLDMLKELIVIDDGSTDGTAEILKNLKYDDRVRLFHHN
ncbi:MAG: glycosyltransferase family 2 protein, partial [Candidatus Omnitrophica bacterium]|nr:glycosyltransferase family 2 protein [Candidatus Omnitrophota bacterium]